jgi:hypothetical protein
MKLNIQTAAALAFTAALSGCVTMEKKPAAFDDGHSLAYNIARAGGLETGIKDASAPRIPIPGCPSPACSTLLPQPWHMRIQRQACLMPKAWG